METAQEIAEKPARELPACPVFLLQLSEIQPEMCDVFIFNIMADLFHDLRIFSRCVLCTLVGFTT